MDHLGRAQHVCNHVIGGYRALFKRGRSVCRQHQKGGGPSAPSHFYVAALVSNDEGLPGIYPKVPGCLLKQTSLGLAAETSGAGEMRTQW